MSEAQLNGHGPDPSLIESWPTAAKLAQLVGVSVRTIGRLQQSGALKRYQARDGTNRYDPDQAAEAIREQTQIDTEAATTKHVLDGSNDVLKQSLELLKQAQLHIDRLQAPAQLALELLQNENRRLAAAAHERDKLDLELFKAREASLSEAHMRQLETTKMEQAEKRKTEIFASLAKVAPRVLAQLQLGGPAAPTAAGVRKPAAAVGDDAQQAQIDACVRLLSSLHASQLEGLLVSGFVDEEQAADIRIILNHAPTTVPPAPASDEELRGS